MVAPSGQEAGNPVLSFLPIILMFVVFYLLLIRPQTKRQKEADKMRSELKKGDHVITSGGIHGTIEGIKDNDVILIKTATDTKIHIGRNAIATRKSK